MRTLLTGGSGRLGSVLKKYLNKPLCPSSSELDVTDRASVDKYFSKHKISSVIHAAAFADVGGCEADPAKAVLLNILGTMNIFNACKIHGARLIYISTDHIFDGKSGNYKENAKPRPAGIYAITKTLAENVTLFDKNNLVIRTSFIKSFPLAAAFEDKYFSGDTAVVIAKDIALAAESALSGIINVGGKKVSIYEVAKKLNPKVTKMKLKDNPITKCGLPYLKDTSLNTSKWQLYKKRHKFR
jgi:dTDP-4-dehydrorhamnose reductase